MVENIEIDMDRVQRLSFKISRLVIKKSRNPLEGLYALKACLYVLRSTMREAGIFVDNEAQLDADLVRSIESELGGDNGSKIASS